MRDEILCAGTHNKSSRKLRERRRLEEFIPVLHRRRDAVHPVYLLVTAAR